MVAASAYRAGLKLKDERSGKTHDYSRRSKGVVESKIICPEGSPGWVHDPARLWNRVEASEGRIDSQLAREFILAVPPELPAKAQFQLAVDWAQKELVTSGMITEISLHHSKTGTNPHVHLLCTMRKIDGDGFSAKKPREWNDKAVLIHQRESWCDAVNAALEKAGRPERVDHRSLKDQGIADRIPQPKIGRAATAMKRKGLVEDPERFQEVRYVKTLNEVMPQMKAIKQHGEVNQDGMGASWWEKSVVFMSRIQQQARDAIKGAWQKLLDSQRTKPETKGPELEK